MTRLNEEQKKTEDKFDLFLPRVSLGLSDDNVRHYFKYKMSICDDIKVTLSLQSHTRCLIIYIVEFHLSVNGIFVELICSDLLRNKQPLFQPPGGNNRKFLK